MTSVPSLFTRQLRGVVASTPPGTLQMHIRTEVQTEVHYTSTSPPPGELLGAKPPSLTVGS